MPFEKISTLIIDRASSFIPLDSRETEYYHGDEITLSGTGDQ